MMSTHTNRGLLAACALALASAASAATKTADKPERTDGYEMKSVLDIGGADAPDESSFYEKFGGVAVDADGAGNVYVLDNGNARIQVFGPDGAFVRSVGSEGQGPGEFQIPGRFAVNAAGDVAVFDMGQARVSDLDKNGALKWDAVTGEVTDLAFTDSGILLLGYGKRGPAEVEAYDASGNKLWSAGTNTPPGGRMVNVKLEREQIAPRLGFGKRGGCFRTPEGEYLVEVFSTKGDETASFARPFERQAITEEDMAGPKKKDGETEEPKVIMIRRDGGGADGGAGGGPGGGTPGGSGTKWNLDGHDMKLTMDNLKNFLPKNHPDTRGVLAWPDGRIWILTAKDDHGVVTDEWSADGKWLRRFTVPEEYDWLNVGRDGALYGVTHDEDDYPTVHRIAVSPQA